MFEDSMFESRVGHVSSSKRWTTLASVGLQVAVAGLVVALPLWHPEAMPFRLEAPKVLMPLMRKPPLPVVQAQQQASSAPSMSIPVETTTRALIPSSPGSGAQVSDVPSLLPFGSGMGDASGVPIGIGVGSGPIVSVASVKPPARVPVSTGVLQGMLLTPIRPVYPMIARAAHVEGAVVVEAIISRTGAIESLRVVSGPEMLRAAAIDAIREARYRPYCLNGEPVDVETTLTVNFRIGG
jgi:periplasmic protein TonB